MLRSPKEHFKRQLNRIMRKGIREAFAAEGIKFVRLSREETKRLEKLWEQARTLKAGDSQNANCKTDD